MIDRSTQQPSNRSVRLNVYYLTPYCSLNTMFNITTLGLFTPYHSAVEIDGSEYAFYGHPFGFSGVMSGKPNRTAMLLAYSKIYGKILLTDEDIETKAHNLGFAGVDYNLLHFNCNTFADAFLYSLTRHHLPGWVSRQERCLGRMKCLRRLFRENNDISGRIVTALYIKSAGDQATVFNLLNISTDQRLTTVYEVMLQDQMSRGKIPNFERLRAYSDQQIEARLSDIRIRFLSQFPTSKSITLNRIFDNLPSLQRQLHRLERRIRPLSSDKFDDKEISQENETFVSKIGHLSGTIEVNELPFADIPSQEINENTYDNDGDVRTEVRRS